MGTVDVGGLVILRGLSGKDPGARLFPVVTAPAGGRLPLWSPKLGDQVAIVADGVARVRWTFGNRAGRPGHRINVDVVNNVAFALTQRLTGFLLGARWYAADGTLVPTSDRALRQAIADQMRAVTKRSGIRVWLIRGARGMCVAVLDQPRFPPDRLETGGAEDCTANLTRAESDGAGLSSGHPGGVRLTYGILPKTRPTVVVWNSPHTHRTIRPPDGVYVVRRAPR